MRAYLGAKIAWLKGGETGPEPPLTLLTDGPVSACATLEIALSERRPARTRRKPAN
jgi:hypothetical protein